MRVGDEASMIAKDAARDEESPNHRPDSGADQARTLRYAVMLALRKAIAAHDSLISAVDALIEDGTDFEHDGAYPDVAVALNLTGGPAEAYAEMVRWIASLEGRASLMRLMLDGPPGGDASDSVQLVDVASGDRFTLTAGGALLNENAAPVSWPSNPLHRRFSPGSAEPGREVRSVWTLNAEGQSLVRFNRVERDRRDHDRDVWSDADGMFTVTWSSLNDVELLAHDPMNEPNHG